MTTDSIITLILAEKRRAERKFPAWPRDPVHAVAILAEESGEAVKAALDYCYLSGSLDDLRDELIQTGAMAVRCLEHLNEYTAKFPRSEP